MSLLLYSFFHSASVLLRCRRVAWLRWRSALMEKPADETGVGGTCQIERAAGVIGSVPRARFILGTWSTDSPACRLHRFSIYAPPLNGNCGRGVSLLSCAFIFAISSGHFHGAPSVDSHVELRMMATDVRLPRLIVSPLRIPRPVVYLPCYDFSAHATYSGLSKSPPGGCVHLVRLLGGVRDENWSVRAITALQTGRGQT